MNDLRIKEMMENLRKVHRLSNSEGGTPETQKLNRDTFKSYVKILFSIDLCEFYKLLNSNRTSP